MWPAQDPQHLIQLQMHWFTYWNICLQSINIYVVFLGRELWVLILGQHPREHRTGIPEFKYVGNMHGNEVMQLFPLIIYCKTQSKQNLFLEQISYNSTASKKLNLFSLYGAKFGIEGFFK